MIQLPRSGGAKLVVAGKVSGAFFHNLVIMANIIENLFAKRNTSQRAYQICEFVIMRRNAIIYAQGKIPLSNTNRMR